MNLEQTINNDIKSAMLAKDADRLKALRSIKSEILLAKTSGKAEEITAEHEMKMLQKMIKQRKESAEIYAQQNRTDLSEPELAEAAIIAQYLPKQMTISEIETKVKEIISKLGLVSIKEMGKVMGIASKELAGKADGKIVSEIVKKTLS